MPDTEKIRELKQKLQNLESMREALGDTAYAAAKAALETQLHAEGAIFAAPVSAQRDVVGRDQYNLNLLLAESARDILRKLPQLRLSAAALQTAAETYLRCLYDRHSFLNLKGMGVSDRVPLRLPLLDLYVPLKARLTLPEGETWQRVGRLVKSVLSATGMIRPEGEGWQQDLELAGRPFSKEDQTELTGRLGEPQLALKLLQKHDGLIILGDPGAGKTTFLKMLALRLALGQSEAVGLKQRLPLLAPLSAYANALAASDVRLDDFIAAYFRDIGSDLPVAEILAEAFKKGQALILLDGLDEVKDPAQRHTVVERVVDFYTFHRRAGNKFVLTSRIVGYREVRPTAPDLAECTLVDFAEEEIADFVARWTQTLEQQALGDDSPVAGADAARERQELLDAIERNPSVGRLAANPLLLTILALMKRQGVTLPERRVELYDQYVRTMLSSWNRTRGLGRPPSRELDVVQTMRTLAPLALWMHETNPGAGLVKREALRRHLEEIFTAQGTDDPPSAARRFLADVREHAGLLLERGPGEYGFIHLTFEEYLAAVAIALRGQGDCRPIVDYLSTHVGDAAWREVSLLTVPYLGIIQQLDRVAGAVVEALVAEQPGDPGAAVILAGQAVLDAGATGVPAHARQSVTGALIAAMQSVEVTPILRREAGLILGVLGWRPPDLDAFVEIPAGPFLMGSVKTDDQAYDDEKPQHEHTLSGYYISRYPVTNDQFRPFVEGDGYTNRAYWTEQGWAWREGAEADLSVWDGVKDEKKWKQRRREWLAQRPVEKRDRPYYWGDPSLGAPLCPVVGITWFEAYAYTRWLEKQWQVSSSKLQVWSDGQIESLAIRNSQFAIRLPSEVEWEKAARGPDGLIYPWGNEWREDCANTEESELKLTSPVGIFPKGDSPYGVSDMVGNVWEWTRSRYEERTVFENDYKYPYNPEDGREKPEGIKIPVLRGGSWSSNQRNARCAARGRDNPGNFNANIGFRVIVSLVIPEF